MFEIFVRDSLIRAIRKENKWSDCITLYCFLQYTLELQILSQENPYIFDENGGFQGNIVYATVGYCMERLEWTEDRVRLAKKKLIKHDLIIPGHVGNKSVLFLSWKAG